jgi:hypothetical protein
MHYQFEKEIFSGIDESKNTLMKELAIFFARADGDRPTGAINVL